MKNILYIFIIIVATSFGQKAYSCSCIGESTVKEAVKSSDIVVFGQIISKEIVKTYDTLDLSSNYYSRTMFPLTEAKYKILVIKKYKGKITTDTLTIVTGIGGGDCGFKFEVGKQYIVYASSDNYNGFHKEKKLPLNTYSTNICMRTTTYNEEESKEIINTTN